MEKYQKVELFSRDKPEIFYCSSAARTIIVRGFVEGKNTFYQLIRNFVFFNTPTTHRHHLKTTHIQLVFKKRSPFFIKKCCLQHKFENT